MNLNELEITTTQNPTAGGWNATAAGYLFTGTGSTEEEAIESLKAQIKADVEAAGGTVETTNESTEGEGEGK